MSSSDPMKDAAAARDEVMKCEAEIQSIKVKLRRLGTSPNNSDGEPNTLEIVLLKVEDLPEGAQPHLSLQLSSPVEEGFLTEVFDPLQTDPSPPAKGSMVSFRGVETSMAMLTITAKDADIPLGVSASLEVASLCKHDAMDDKEKFVTELPIAILAEGQEATETASLVVADAPADADAPAAEEEAQEKGDDATIDTAKEEDKEAKEESTDVVEPVQVEEVEASAEEATTTTTETAGEEEKTTETVVEDDKPPTEEEEKQVEPEAKQEVVAPVEVVAEEATATAVAIPPVCTVVLRFTYSPSPKDRREDLYELLNKTSQRKATALENLRRISMAAQSSPSSSPTNRTNADGGAGGSGVMTTNTPAVKAGFLNKGAKKVKEPTRMERFYDRVLGPNSILMQGIAIVTVGKNYLIFFGAVTFFHFQGQMLALPPPV